MPKLPEPRRDPPTTEIVNPDEWPDFADPSAWKRSQKGNWWRNWDGKPVTIFKRRDDDVFGWSIADGDDVRYSRGSYESEEDAMVGAAKELGIGW